MVLGRVAAQRQRSRRRCQLDERPFDHRRRHPPQPAARPIHARRHRPKTRRRRLMARMNMVPFIDVMLVLLIIFMVQRAADHLGLVDLPSVGKAARQPKWIRGGGRHRREAAPAREWRRAAASHAGAVGRPGHAGPGRQRGHAGGDLGRPQTFGTSRWCAPWMCCSRPGIQQVGLAVKRGWMEACEEMNRTRIGARKGAQSGAQHRSGLGPDEASATTSGPLRGPGWAGGAVGGVAPLAGPRHRLRAPCPAPPPWRGRDSSLQGSKCSTTATGPRRLPPHGAARPDPLAGLWPCWPMGCRWRR